MLRASRAVPVVLAVLALGAAGCSSDDSSTSDSAGTVAPTTASAPMTTAATTEVTQPEVTDASTTEVSEPEVTEVETTEVETTEVETTEAETTEAETTEVEDTEVEDTEMETTTTEAVSVGTTIDVLTEAGQFTTLIAAIEAAGLTETVATSENTLLAPTDEAFAALGQPAIDALLADPAALEAVLRGHLLPIPQDTHGITIFNNIVAINGTSYEVVAEGDTIMIGTATIVVPDLASDNGIVHGIDTVIIPAPAG